MKLDTKFSTSRTENERLERERNEKKTVKKDTYIYGDDGYIIEEPYQKTNVVRRETAKRKDTVRTSGSSSKNSSQSRRTNTTRSEQKKQRNTGYSVQPNRTKKASKKREVGSGFLWLVSALAAIAFAFSFWKLSMLSDKIKYLMAGALALLMFVTGAATSILSPRNIFQKFVNVMMVLVLGVSSVLMPYYEDRISNVIDKVVGNTVRISMYALTQEYKDAHAPKYQNTIDVPEPGKKVNLKDYPYAVYGTFTAADGANQNYVLGEMEDLFKRPVSYTTDYDSARHCADALYNNEIDIIIMSETYVAFIEEIEGYETFSQDTQVLYTYVRTIESDLLVKTDADLCKEPYTIFFGGNDEEGELSLQGRTDVDMLVTVNPQTGQIAIVSLPRDSYIPNPYFDGSEDKLTHLGIYGLDNTIEGLEKYLDIDIDYYVMVNFTTFMRIIEALGGVDVDNPYAFDYTWDDYSYPEGNIHLGGQAALYYVRERYNLPDGDFGRSMHQQLVMKAIIRKLISPALLLNFNGLIKAMEGTFLTNLSSSSIYGLCQYQLDQEIDWNIVNYHVEGSFGYEYTASDSNQLSVVYPYPNQIEFVQEVIQKVYSGEILEQQDIPDGEE